MGYEFALPDTSTRNKLLGNANAFALSDADIMRYLEMIRGQGKQSLAQSFGAAQADIGSQFTPAMRMAQARLGANPLLGDSGYANRLNRQLQGAAYGDLSRAYGNAAAQQSQGEVSALQNLINQRLGERNSYLQAMLGSGQKKKRFGDYALQLGGAAAGTAASAFGGG